MQGLEIDQGSFPVRPGPDIWTIATGVGAIGEDAFIGQDFGNNPGLGMFTKSDPQIEIE